MCGLVGLPDDESLRRRAADRLPSALCRQQFDCLLALLWARAAASGACVYLSCQHCEH